MNTPVTNAAFERYFADMEGEDVYGVAEISGQLERDRARLLEYLKNQTRYFQALTGDVALEKALLASLEVKDKP